MPPRVLANEQEIVCIGHQHQSIAAPVAAHLSAICREPGVSADGLHLDHAALRCLPFAWMPLLHLLCRIEAKIGTPRTLIGKFANAKTPSV